MQYSLSTHKENDDGGCMNGDCILNKDGIWIKYNNPMVMNLCNSRREIIQVFKRLYPRKRFIYNVIQY